MTHKKIEKGSNFFNRSILFEKFDSFTEADRSYSFDIFTLFVLTF
jgi:hypothetical protein